MTPTDPLAAWTAEPRPKPETLRTPDADEGWYSWNGKSPEVEFCDFVAAYAKLVKPDVIIETGVGQGYVTRRLAAACPDAILICYESDPEWRARLATLSFWTMHRYQEDLAVGPHRVLVDAETPSLGMVAQASLLVLDSNTTLRLAEIDAWDQHGGIGSTCIVHDVDETRDEAEIHRILFERLRLIPGGIYLDNPRGGWIGQR